MNNNNFDDPKDGPLGLNIISCISTIDFEQGQIAWAKDRLTDETLTEKQRAIYGEILSDATRVLRKTEVELEHWRTEHFRWLSKRESA